MFDLLVSDSFACAEIDADKGETF